LSVAVVVPRFNGDCWWCSLSGLDVVADVVSQARLGRRGRFSVKTAGGQGIPVSCLVWVWWPEAGFGVQRDMFRSWQV